MDWSSVSLLNRGRCFLYLQHNTRIKSDGSETCGGSYLTVYKNYNLKLVMATGTGTSLSVAPISGCGLVRDTPTIHMLNYRQDSKVWITGKGIQGFADMLGLQTDISKQSQKL